MKKISVLILIMLLIGSCIKVSKKHVSHDVPTEFNKDVLRTDMLPVKKISGQLLYLPVYSNVPYNIDTIKFDMSAFVAIHNTDLESPIILTKVLYFNQDGKLVFDYLKNGRVIIAPLATKDFYVPYEDQSGTGANFLIEWVSDTTVNEPLIESVTTCLKPNNTVAILSPGKVIREK